MSQTPLDKVAQLIVGDRCTHEPCASENWLKIRFYLIAISPPILLLFTGHPLPSWLTYGLLGSWIAAIWIIAKKISQMEPCDEVEHEGQEVKSK